MTTPDKAEKGSMQVIGFKIWPQTGIDVPHNPEPKSAMCEKKKRISEAHMTVTLLAKIIIAQMIEKFPIFYGIRRFVIAFTRTFHVRSPT
jgi:hypothetical protein